MRIFILSLFTFIVMAPSALAAVSVSWGETADVFSEKTSPYTDVSMPEKPLEDTYSSAALYEAAMESYYQNLGIIMFSSPVFNGSDHLEGYTASNGSHYFSPEKTLNRAEAAKFFAAFNPEIAFNDPSGVRGCFRDVEGDDWFGDYVCLLEQAGVVGGYPDKTYRGENTLNNAEIMKFLVKDYELSESEINEAQYDQWYEGYQDVVEKLQIMPEGLDPSANPTRGQMASYIMRAFVVDSLATGEPFDGYQLTLFIEEMQDEAGVDPMFDFIYNPSDEIYIYSMDVESNNESVTIFNDTQLDQDIGGYTIRLLDNHSSDDLQTSQIEYTFPEDTVLDAGEKVSVYTIDGDRVFKLLDEDYPQSNGGVIDSVYGHYAYVLYNSDHELIDMVVFNIP